MDINKIKQELDELKAKIVYHLLTVFMRNIKETSLGRKEKTMIRNMKIMKRKLSLVKVIYLFYNLPKLQ